MVSAHLIADILLNLSRPEVGDSISNLKLQKLLYYTQGLHLAIYKGEPLFEEEILAWNYGPVVENVYHRFKEYGADALPIPDVDIEKSGLRADQIELINDVYDAFGQFSALKLMDMTHNETPWQETEQSSVITHEKLIQYFNTLVKN